MDSSSQEPLDLPYKPPLATIFSLIVPSFCVKFGFYNYGAQIILIWENFDKSHQHVVWICTQAIK